MAYSPAQIRDAYGVNSLSLDGTGQTIAIVDAYDDPDIFQAVDDYDSQFSLTDSGPSLYDQYGPAASFLTVVNQNGQTTSLPETDPTGAGAANWELEESLDVEWAHAIAPGAQIVVVEANSQSLADLMASVATAAVQPGVSVVSMSWGLPEGTAVFASDEATYDSVFNAPGVTFVASTGDYGAADPEYPAFSPNVVAVGGTSLTLNDDSSYNSETGWGYESESVGAFIGSGGGLSLYEPEPAYQQNVQSTGTRTIPDVSFVADPATGAWIADPYNLDADNPFEVVGGTSLSAPTWAGLVALINEGRAVAGEPAFDSTSPTETQQALYSLPQSDYNMITSGFNGYTAGAGYNLVTGLGTPVTNLLVDDLVAYEGPGTTYAGPTVGALQDATLANTGSGGGGAADVFSVFSAITMFGGDVASGQGGTVVAGTGSTGMRPNAGADSSCKPRGGKPGQFLCDQSRAGARLCVGEPSPPAHGWVTSVSHVGPTSRSPATVTIAPSGASLSNLEALSFMGQAVVSGPADFVNLEGFEATDPEVLDRLVPSRRQTRLLSEAVIGELASDSAMWIAQEANGTVVVPVLPAEWGTRDIVIGDSLTDKRDRSSVPADSAGAGVPGPGRRALGPWQRLDRCLETPAWQTIGRTENDVVMSCACPELESGSAGQHRSISPELH